VQFSSTEAIALLATLSPGWWRSASKV
jgi:hypothetical protein